MRVRTRRLLALTTGTLLAVSGIAAGTLPASAAIAPVTVTYDYTGAAQTFQVPAGVTAVSVTAAGGQGARSPYDVSAGGLGAAVSATVAVTSGSTLTVVVAGDGRTYCGGAGNNCGGYGAGSGGNGYYGGGGGGGSAVRDAGGTDLVAAGGGGGAGAGEECTSVDRADGGNGGAAGAVGGQGGACVADGMNLYGGLGGRPGGTTAGGAGGAGGGGTTCDGSVAYTGSGGAAASGANGANGGYSGAGGGGHFGGGAGGERAIASCDATDQDYKSGSGGGGGGSSYVIPSASGASIGLSNRAYGTNGQVSITYTPIVAGITLSPASSSIAAGNSRTYTVTATTTSGGTADVTAESGLSIAPSSGGSATGASCTGSACTAQTAGTYTVTATRGSLTSTATLTVTAGAPAFLTATSGSGQSATAGTAFTSPLVATVTDAYGNLVPGATVAFAVDPSSTGTATVSNNGQATTGSDGQASVTLTAGATSGPVTVTATSGTGSTAFLETVTPAGPARADLTVTLDGPASVRNGSSATLTITVKNAGPSASGKYAAAIALPRQLTPTASSGGTRYGSVVVFRGTNLASGASASYQVTVTTRSKGATGYAGAAMATTGDPKLGNNVAVRSITIT